MPLLTDQAQAQSFARKSVDINRTNLTPVMDGILDDEIWQHATVITDFHQVTPVDQGEPSQRSVFYVTYDDEFLYVAARLYDSNPELISARQLIQGQRFRFDDRIEVMLDTFNNTRTGFSFLTNPNGIRVDGVFENPNNRNLDWTGIWFAASNIDEEGWTAEIAIPWTTLNFDPNQDAWGFNLVRQIPRTNETIAWSSFNRATDPSTAGQVRGIENIRQGLGLDIIPSLSLIRQENHLNGTSENHVEPSLDVFYKFTPNLTGAVTINTDFSASQVDSRQVNLTRFNQFFPEQREFFLQDSEIFAFGGLGNGYNNGMPFYSRRIGLDANTGRPVDINIGGKLAGRIGDVSLGALVVQQGKREGLDSQEVMVGRVAANVLSESRLGAIVTHGDPNSEDSNSVAGVDFAYRNTRFTDTHSLRGNFWYQQSETANRSGDEKAYRADMNLSTEGTGFSGQLNYTYIGEDYYPALGFVRRRGIDRVGGEVSGRYFLRGHPHIRNLFTRLQFEHTRRLADENLQSEKVEYRIGSINTHRGDALRLDLIREREGLNNVFQIRPGIFIPEGKYSFSSWKLTFAGAERDFSPELTYQEGDFYDGTRSSATANMQWRPSAHLGINFKYDYTTVSMPQGDFISRLVSTETLVAFNRHWSWITLVQYDNGSNSVGVNSRLNWTPQAGENFYFIVNYDMDSSEGAFDGLSSMYSEVVLKYVKNFRF